MPRYPWQNSRKLYRLKKLYRCHKATITYLKLDLALPRPSSILGSSLV